MALRSMSQVCHITVVLLSPLFHSRMGPSANSSKSGASSSGLLSNVFGFFSREIESFVVNAAGGPVQASHVKRDHEHRILIHLSQKSPEPGPSGASHKPKRVKKKSRRVSDAVYSSPPNPKRGKGPTKDKRGRRPTANQPSHLSDESDASRIRNEPGKLCSYFPAICLFIYFYTVFLKPPSPIPREKASLKPSPVTMPGSLFPRSPSMFPEFAPVLQTPRIQRISDNVLSPTLEQPDTVEVQVHPTLEGYRAEAEISSGVLSQ